MLSPRNQQSEHAATLAAESAGPLEILAGVGVAIWAAALAWVAWADIRKARSDRHRHHRVGG